MNILLIDDDDYIVEAVKTMVDWEKIGIDGIFTANGTIQARQILEQVPVEIMLCDIEIGSENGLDFVEWMRGRGNETKVIFLTSYAEFSYAQKAIALNSVDYLLKPVSFPELEKLLGGIVERVHQEADLMKNKEQWMQSRQIRAEGFWRRVLVDGTDREEYRRQEECFGLSYPKEGRFLYIQLTMMDYKQIYEKLERGMLDFLVRNLAGELFSGAGYTAEAILGVDGEDTSWWEIVLGGAGNGIDRALMERLGQECLERFKSLTGGRARLYVGRPASLEEMAERAKEVMHMAEDDVYTTGGARFLEDYEHREIPYVEPSFSEWEALLLAGRQDKMVTEVEQYLSHLRISGDCNSRTLRSFLADFQQMIYVVLRKRNITMSRLMDKPEGEEMNLAVHSITYMKQYVRRQVERAAVGLKLVEKEQSVVEKVREYMEEHLGEELTREDFAAQVFLNGDYLARIFKKETGMSIGAYLLEKRMQRAKQILVETKKPVNQIAAEVGYTNFSYFAKLFKRSEGMTPNEYRKQRT